jgi:hypothetical protein
MVAAPSRPYYHCAQNSYYHRMADMKNASLTELPVRTRACELLMSFGLKGDISSEQHRHKPDHKIILHQLTQSF